MSITLTNRELLMARDGLAAVGKRAFGSIRTTFAVAVLKRRVASALEDLEQARVALVGRYKATENPDGATLDIDERQRASFERDFNALLNVTTTVEASPITLAMLDGVEGLTPDDLFLLGPLLAEGAGDLPAGGMAVMQ